VTFGQTLRINVSASPSGSCIAQLGFLDTDGKPVGPNSGVSLKASESASLDLPSSAVVTRPGQRVEVRPRLVPDSSTTPSACETSVSVLDAQAEPGPQEAKEAKPAGGMPEGIKVHGHWTIEVRDPDGTVATHREFENSLTGGGAIALAQILSGTGIGGTFLVQAGNSVAASSPCTPQGCLLFQTYDVNASLNGFQGFNTLKVTTPTGANPYSGDLVLSGGFTAPQAGSINQVATLLNVCLPTAPAGVCNFSNLATEPLSGPLYLGATYQFTFAPPLSFSAVSFATNQFVQVTVAIGFS
jgi:hypothetical protein